MNIVTVIPIARGIGKDSLSYFSANDIPVGSFVKVPMRSKQVPALVLSSTPADEMKAELKNSDFSLKKIGRTKTVSLLLPEFIEAAEEAASYFAGSTGSVLASIIPKIILEQADKIKIGTQTNTPSKPDIGERHEPYSLQADEEDRLAHYKSLIREQFARKKSVFFCLPTIQDAKRIFETLPKGIEQYTFVINAALSKKELVDTWNKIVEESHPVLVIMTGSFLGIARKDIGAIIIERESSGGYKFQTRPYIDTRTFAEIYAKKLGARLVYGDLLLRTETLWRARNGEFAELAPMKFRSTSTANTHIVDMKKYKTLETPEFKILSEEIKLLIEKNKEENENLFVFAARRGLSPMTVCGDCGTTVICTRCSAPIVLHKGKNSGGDAENFFLCHRCGERRSAEEKCRNCGSWKLTTLGLGIELIEDSIHNLFPDITLFRMDKDTVKTHKQALSIASQFYNSPGSILIGTEMALSYLEKPIENSAVAAIDSLFSIPDFRIGEKIMNILLRMRSITRKAFVIQTRSRDQHLFDYAIKGNLSDFYREELEEREKLSYPPFSTLIKVTVRNTKARALHDMEFVEKLLADYQPLVFPAFIETVDKKSIMHALIKLKPKEWVSETLLEKLRSLPPHITVNVDPESLL